MPSLRLVLFASVAVLAYGPDLLAAQLPPERPLPAVTTASASLRGNPITGRVAQRMPAPAPQAQDEDQGQDRDQDQNADQDRDQDQNADQEQDREQEQEQDQDQDSRRN